jgi:ribose transport system permease protein
MRTAPWLRRNVTLLSAYGLCLLLFAVATGYSSGFASAAHLRSIFIFSAFVGFAALGQTVVVLAGGLDLSVPWLMAFGGIQLSQWAGVGGVPDWLVIVAVVGIGAAVGLVNGLGVTLLGVSPIVMTIAVGGLVQAYLLSVGLLQSTGNQVPNSAVRLATGRIGGVPVIALVWLGVALLAGFVLARTAFGRRVYAVGSNDTVAWFSGVDVTRVRITTYVIAGASSTLAGIVLAGYIGTSYLDIGQPYLFASIAAVAVGGASILGGRGSYWGTIAGVLTLTVLSDMLPLFHLANPALDIVYGVVILVGVYLSRLGRLLARGSPD